MSIAIVSLAIGPDFKKAMEVGFKSKRDYAERHGYTYIQGGEEYWLRDRPIPWSKIPFFLEQLEKYDWVWFSDADSLITNPEIRLEDLFQRCFQNPETHAVWWRDGCGNINSGQILARGRSPIIKKWLEETAKQEDLWYHIWWENAGMRRVWNADPEINKAIQLRDDYKTINSYLFPTEGRAAWSRGDFVLHCAGVYEISNICRFMKYVQQCILKGVDPDMRMLIEWFKSPLALKDVL